MSKKGERCFEVYSVDRPRQAQTFNPAMFETLEEAKEKIGSWIEDDYTDSMYIQSSL